MEPPLAGRPGNHRTGRDRIHRPRPRAGTAHAAPITAEGSVRIYNGTDTQVWIDISRTVSQSTVNQGDTITITTTFSSGSDGHGGYGYIELHQIQDSTPPCLAYVDGSGKTSTNDINERDNTVTAHPRYGWDLNSGNRVTLTADYTVNCAPGQHNTGGLNAETWPSNDDDHRDTGWLSDRSTGTGNADPVSGIENDFGPTITVTTAGGNGNGNGNSGSSEGSLSGLFGSS